MEVKVLRGSWCGDVMEFKSRAKEKQCAVGMVESVLVSFCTVLQPKRFRAERFILAPGARLQPIRPQKSQVR